MSTLVKTDRAKMLRSKEIPPLTPKDRCDRCLARAYVVVLVREATEYLNFCVHHFNQHSEVLYRKADLILDERKSLVNS